MNKNELVWLAARKRLEMIKKWGMAAFLAWQGSGVHGAQSQVTGQESMASLLSPGHGRTFFDRMATLSNTTAIARPMARPSCIAFEHDVGPQGGALDRVSGRYGCKSSKFDCLALFCGGNGLLAFDSLEGARAGAILAGILMSTLSIIISS